MASAVKKTTFEDYQQTLSTVLDNIDKHLIHVKNRQKNLSVWKGFDSFKDFLKDVEKKALRQTVKDLELATSTVRDRWKVLTLPTPVYSAIEDGRISFSKAKPLTAIDFDFENDNDIAVAEEIVKEIEEKKIAIKDIKDLVAEYSPKVWNPSDIIIQRIAEQYGITEDTRC